MKAYYHFTVGGELFLEDEEVLAEDFDDVSCRWCASGKSVEVIVEEPTA